MSTRKKLRFLIISSKMSDLSMDLAEEIRLAGHEWEFCRSKDFIFEINNGSLSVKTRAIDDILDFDIYLFRSFSKTMANSRILVEELQLRGKTVIENCISDSYVNSKLWEGARFARAGISHPRTFQVSRAENADSIPPDVFPAIIKPADGSKGRGIRIVRSRDELESALLNSTEDLLIQEKLDIDWDLRIFVVGNEALGAMKRYVADGDCRSNASLGSKVENFDITDETKKLALLATDALGYEVAGVDLAWDASKNRWYVLEVNISPQWHAFKRVTGTNPARCIIKHSMKLHSQKTAL